MKNKVCIVRLGINSPWGCGVDDFWDFLEYYDSNIKTVVTGPKHDEKCCGHASLLPESMRNGFDTEFFNMNPVQVHVCVSEHNFLCSIAL